MVEESAFLAFTFSSRTSRSDVDTLAVTMRMEERRFVYVLRSEVDRRPSARPAVSGIMMHVAEEYAFRRCLEADVTSTK